MKFYVLLFTFIFGSLVIKVQAKTFDRFNKLSSKFKHGFELSIKNGAVSSEGKFSSAEAVVDDKNQYPQIKVLGTGGGTFELELCIFNTVKGTEILAYKNYTISSDGNEVAGFSFFFYTEITEAGFWSDIDHIRFVMPKEESDTDIEKYKSPE